MALFDFFDIATLKGRRRVTPHGWTCLTATAGALALGGLLVATPAGRLQAASPAPVPCKFAPVRQTDRDQGVDPQLLIDGTCIDPDYNEKTFVITEEEKLTYQVPGGPLIPYTQVTGHFPAMKTPATLPPGVTSSPTLSKQDYVWRFPAKEYWRNRSMQQQHPTGHGTVDNRLAFTNGAFSMNWVEGPPVATHRHHAAATKLAKAFANKLYGNTAKIYSYYWGCSGGGTVAMAAAENTVGVWDGVQPHCIGTNIDAQYHSFYWQALYTMGIPEAKRNRIAEAAAPGGSGDIYAGLNEEEKAVLNEFISAGYPLPFIGNHFKNLTPLVPPWGVRGFDPTYEDDFWSKPGYAGANPPNFLKAALVDGFATITGISRNAAGVPTAIQFDLATVPRLGSIGATNLNYYVFAADGKTRTIDPAISRGSPARFSLNGTLDTAKGILTLTGNNSSVLLNALREGGKIRINNRFILAVYFYPRYSNVPGIRSHDQYRNANGTAKYPQRQDISHLNHSSYRTMGGRVETGAITTKVMIIEGMGDNLSWPIFNVSYAEKIQRTLGTARANSMMRVYLHDNGRHAVGGGEQGIFYQSLIDMIAWVEKGIPPKPSTRYTIRNGQVILLPRAADRRGLQPVMDLAANGSVRAAVGVNQPVTLVSRIEMPPAAGRIVQYGWTVAGKPDPVTNVVKPQPMLSVNRTVSFDKPGTYIVRLSVNGQRDGLVNPANQTLLQNWKEVRVVVQ